LTDNAATRYLDAEGNVHYGEIGPKTRTPKIMLIYAWSANLEFHDLIERVAIEAKRYKIDKLLVEAKASGISVAQELKRLYKNERWLVQLVNPGNMDKVARLHSVVPIFANGLVYAPDKSWAQLVIDQVTQFPKSRYKDIVDTTSQCLRHLRDIGMLETREEVEADLNDHMAFDSNADMGMYF
jgi:predicted phage terminase large subunit-like protein